MKTFVFPTTRSISRFATATLFCAAGMLIHGARAQSSIPQTIETVAGTGVNGYNGTNIPALKAEIFQPTFVAFDAGGNLYFSQGGNQLVSRVDAKTGIIQTVAGDYSATYQCLFSGDGGLATKATLCSPGGLAFDGAGNLLIADTSNQRIRRVDHKTLIITTVAGNGAAGFSGDGGPATNASFNNPNGIRVDGLGNLYIADTSNDRVRRVDGKTGIISTVAGNGTGGDGGPAVTAQLGYVFDVAFDAEGDLLISDSGENRVRLVNHKTGIISTIVGNGTSGYSGDGGPATQAELDSPAGLALDQLGNLYIADYQRLRRVDRETQTITTISGNGMAGFNGDGPAKGAELSFEFGLAVNQNKLYIGDQDNQRVRRIAPLNEYQP